MGVNIASREDICQMNININLSLTFLLLIDCDKKKDELQAALHRIYSVEADTRVSEYGRTYDHQETFSISSAHVKLK